RGSAAEWRSASPPLAGAADRPVRDRTRADRGALRRRELRGPMVPAAATDDAGRDRALADRLPTRAPRCTAGTVGCRRARHRATGRAKAARPPGRPGPRLARSVAGTCG